MSLDGAEVESWKYLAVCVPIVVFFAPLGSYVSSHFHRQVLAVLIYVLDTMALVSPLPGSQCSFSKRYNKTKTLCFPGHRSRRPPHDPVAVARVCRTHPRRLRLLLGHLDIGRENQRGQSGPRDGRRRTRRHRDSPMIHRLFNLVRSFKDNS